MNICHNLTISLILTTKLHKCGLVITKMSVYLAGAPIGFSLKVSLVGSFLVYCEVLFPKTINNFQNFNHNMSVVRNLCLLVVIKLLFNWRTIAL